MTITFKRATRENVGLLIGLVGGTGSGKTYTAMRLASGICGGKPFAVIDSESGRAKHYADQFVFDHAELREPFRPEAYVEAIMAADAAGYPAIVVDSASHVWAGSGGVLDWHEEELTRMAGDDWKKREACKMAAWIKPKMSHKKMVQRLLQVRAHLLLCFRAEEKIEIVKEGGKTVIVPKQSLSGLDGWIPVADKNLPYELTTSFLFTADRPGIPKPIKLQQQHRALFPLEQQVNEESGKRIAEWAAGGMPVQRKPEPEPRTLEQSETILRAAAGIANGTATQRLGEMWGATPKEHKAKLKPLLDGQLKAQAKSADDAAKSQAPVQEAAGVSAPVVEDEWTKQYDGTEAQQ